MEQIDKLLKDIAQKAASQTTEAFLQWEQEQKEEEDE